MLIFLCVLSSICGNKKAVYFNDKAGEKGTLLGNGVVGILSETTSVWERRTPLTPAHCAWLLNRNKNSGRVTRIVVQPSTRRIHHDALYEDVGCEISEDLSKCGVIVGVKQPRVRIPSCLIFCNLFQ